MSNEILIIGIGSHAVGIDRATGTELWRTRLKGGDFVTVFDSDQYVFAGAGGVLFCLETTKGRILWKNQLKGLGTGLITFMSSNDAAGAAVLAKRRATAAAVAATGS
jgi:outer membrane protein assembly factor BamB